MQNLVFQKSATEQVFQRGVTFSTDKILQKPYFKETARKRLKD